MYRILYLWNTFIRSILEVKTNTIDYKNFDALLTNLNEDRIWRHNGDKENEITRELFIKA